MTLPSFLIVSSRVNVNMKHTIASYTACLLILGASSAIELVKPRGTAPAVQKIDFYKASHGEASGLVRQQVSITQALDNTAVGRYFLTIRL